MADNATTQTTHSREQGMLSHGGWLPYLWAALSVAVCYIKAITVAVSPMWGVAWDINPHIQALLMVSFGALVAYAIHRDQDKHQDHRPFYIAVAGLVIMAGTLYTVYDIRILFLGYFFLLVGAFANQNAILKRLNLQVQRQNAQIQQQAEELADWNRTLEIRVNEQVAELDRIGQLKRFLSPEVVDIVVAHDDKSLLDSHRRYVAALFCDLRGFTAFSERAEPEEVINFLQVYHQTLGRITTHHSGTINHSAGDGLMIIFNDPLPCEQPVRRAVELAFAGRDAVREIVQDWEKFGYNLGFGIGIAAGYATLGVIGDNTRSYYTAIGNVINLASRLCDQARDDEILISQRAYREVEDVVQGHEVEGLKLKGISQLQEAYRITHMNRVSAESL